MKEGVVILVPPTFDGWNESEDTESRSIFCVLEGTCKLGLEQALGKMSLAEVTEVVWPSDCPGLEILFHQSNVEKVINCTGEDTNLCGGAVRVGNLVGRVGEDWWSDCVGIPIRSHKQDLKFGTSRLRLGGCCGTSCTLFCGGDILCQ